jgi:hypothetical protein
MTVDEFRVSADEAKPPSGSGKPLLALWFDAKGDWARAHSLAQELDDATGAWVHAYLHRVEGDLGNAAYWYHRAGRPVANTPLTDEWTQIAVELLAR